MGVLLSSIVWFEEVSSIVVFVTQFGVFVFPCGGFLHFFFLLVVFMVAVSCDYGCWWWFLAIFCVSFPLGGCFLWLLLVVSLVVVVARWPFSCGCSHYGFWVWWWW